MAKRLTMAIGNRYDTKYFLTGEVRVDGFDVEYVNAGPAPAPIFNDMVTRIPYDIGEQSISNYVIAKDQGKPLTAVPVFPSCFFPQLGLSVQRESTLRQSSDLVGKRIGVSQGFASNPAVWLRGILMHYYDVSAERIIWVEGERDSLAGVDYPRSRRFTIEKAEGLAQRLEAGAVDAVIAPSGGLRAVSVRPLFPDPYQEIEVYVRATSIFPLNTVLTLKEEVVREHPGLVESLMEACRVAKRRYHDEVLGEAAATHMDLDIGRLRAMGVFPFEYGLAANRPAIRLLIHYCYEQGLIRTLFEPEDLFVDGGKDAGPGA